MILYLSLLFVMDINLGYACINTELRKKDVFCSRTCRISTLKKNPEILSVMIDANLQDLIKILHWNKENNVRLFRISSQLFPFHSHEEYGYSIEPWRDILSSIGDLAKQFNIRLTFHPGQFCVLSSDKEEVVSNTLREIDCHSNVLDMMGCSSDSVIVIHGGSKKPGALERFKTNFRRLSISSQSRLVLENCETCYKVEDLLPVCCELNIPLVLDYHHFNLNKELPLDFLMKFILKTWERRNIRPKFHVSESEECCGESLTARRKHSNIVNNLPDLLPEGIDLMIEAKLKEQSIPILLDKMKLKNKKNTKV
jgi:UV DNA damage endonuclease